MTKNTETTIDITGVSTKGFGIGRAGDFVLFVEGGLPGDRLAVQVVRAKSRYGYGEIISILHPSSHRIKGPCNVADRCGGCQWQHCNYQAQLDFKKQIVVDALERIGGIKNPPIADTAGMENPWGYRNKGVFPIKNGAIGMYEAKSHNFVEIGECAIQHPAHAAIFRALQGYLCSNIRSVMIRVGFATDEIMVAFTMDGESLPQEDQLVTDLVAAGATTVLVNQHVVFGPGYIHEHIGNTVYQLSAPSFFQVNPVQAKVLYDIAMEQAGLDGTQTLLDAHVGAGGAALYGAARAHTVIGVDIAPSAIEDARKNAELNGIYNARFICGTAEEVIPALLAEGVRPNVVFLDPPRKGCDAILLDALVAARIEKIVYISCDPATLARDMKVLTAGGYKLTDVRPVDMFPMTAKVEVSCLLVLE